MAQNMYHLNGLDAASRQISPAHLLGDGELLELLLEPPADLITLQALDAGQKGEPDHDTRRLARHSDHVEAGGRMFGVLTSNQSSVTSANHNAPCYLSDELDVGAILEEAKVGPALDDLVHLAGRLPALHRVVAAIGARGQKVFGQRVIVLEQEADPETEIYMRLYLDNIRDRTPVGVHPSMPDVYVKTANWLPERCEDGMGEVGRVGDWGGAAGLDDE